MKKTHSPNCNCYECTSGDDYIAHIRGAFGKNAAHFDAAFSGGSQYGYNQYDSHYNDLSIAPVKTTTLQPVQNTTVATGDKANLKKILGDALGSVVGDLIQSKKDGQTLPPLLDKVASLGIKTEQVALNATQKKAESEIGANFLKFSPWIIGGVVGLVLLVFFLGGRKS